MSSPASLSSMRSKSSPSGAVPSPSSVTLTLVRPSLRLFRGGRTAPLMPQASSTPSRPRTGGDLFFRFGSEAQRITLGRAGFGAAGGLGLGDVLHEHGDDADAFAMRGHHNVERLSFVEAENRLQHLDHEVARGIIVVEQYDLVQARARDARLGLDLPLGGDLAHRPLLKATLWWRRQIFCTRGRPVSSRFADADRMPRRSNA